MDPDKELSTKELRISQEKREAGEREGAEQADTEAEAAQHDRRADKSAYLKRKLAERERSELESEQD